MTILEIWYRGGGYERHAFMLQPGGGIDLDMLQDPSGWQGKDVLRIKISQPLPEEPA